MFHLYREALVELGFEIFDVPVEAFFPPDRRRIGQLRADLKQFRPQLAFGLPKGAYALICRLEARWNRQRPNLFTDVLEIPTICLWDHAPLELADQLLTPHPTEPAASKAGAMKTLRRALRHPCLIHWSPDSGQTQVMQELGLALPNRVIQEPLPAPPISASPVEPSPGVGFVGHFYQEERGASDPRLRDVAKRAISEWLKDCEQPLWRRLLEQAGGMSRAERKKCALDFDQTYFWHFAHRLIIHEAQTALRLRMLGAAGVPVTCYGNLKTDALSVPRNLRSVTGHIPYGPDVAAALARHEISLDVFNPGAIHGFSTKPLVAFASGGFMLVNRKRDFLRAFGEAGEEVSYGDDPAAKIDHFLSNPKRRREVAGVLRDEILKRFQLRDVLARVVDASLSGGLGAGS